MRYQTTTGGESAIWLVDSLPSGGTATITVYDLSDGLSVALNSNSCAEIGTTGLYKWSSAQITTQPTTMKQYAFQMTDGTLTTPGGKFVLGGYPDDLESKLDTVDTVVDGIQADLDNATDGLGAIKTAVDANQTDLNTIISSLLDARGLMNENMKILSPVYNSDNLLTSATLQQYTDNTLGTTRKAWTLTATYNSDKEMTAFQVVEA